MSEAIELAAEEKADLLRRIKEVGSGKTPVQPKRSDQTVAGGGRLGRWDVLG